jgi:hypothetical protein
MLDHVNPEHHLRSMIGYHLAWENSLIGMVMVQGKQREVINIGLGIKQVAVEPRDVTVPQYVESLSHKVRVCVATRFFLLSFFFLFVFTTTTTTRPTAGLAALPYYTILFLPGHATTHANAPHHTPVNLSRTVLPQSGPRRRRRPPPALHPPSSKSSLHQSDRPADRLRLVPARVQHLRGDVQRRRAAAHGLGVQAVQVPSRRAASRDPHRGDLPVRHGPFSRDGRLQVRVARHQQRSRIMGPVHQHRPNDERHTQAHRLILRNPLPFFPSSQPTTSTHPPHPHPYSAWFPISRYLISVFVVPSCSVCVLRCVARYTSIPFKLHPMLVVNIRYPVVSHVPCTVSMRGTPFHSIFLHSIP